MREVLLPTREVELLLTLPGVGFILATMIALEVGDVGGPDSEHLASYAGLVPRVHASGGKARYGRTHKDVKRYLKWAYSEAGNVVARYHKDHPHRHVSVVYVRICKRKGHQVAVGALGRHLAEASYWMLKKGAPYRDPGAWFREVRGVSAADTWAKEAREVIARRPGENLMPRGRRRDVSHPNGPKAMWA